MIEIIFDNGGGATLQDRDNRYIHNYQDMDQLAVDVIDLRDGGSTADWDGNEYDDYVETQKQAAIDCGDDPDDLPDDTGFIDPSYDDIRNGGYRVYNLDELLSEANDADLDDVSWNNIRKTLIAIKQEGTK